MKDPELNGQAKTEWEKLERLVELDAEAQIELHREESDRTNSWRVRNGLAPI